jgi:hypothetical protein
MIWESGLLSSSFVDVFTLQDGKKYANQDRKIKQAQDEAKRQTKHLGVTMR